MMAARQIVHDGRSILEQMKRKYEPKSGRGAIYGHDSDFSLSLKSLVAQLLCHLNKKTQKRLAASASENERRQAREGSYRSETVGRR